jgi:Omp85 superfamily domain
MTHFLNRRWLVALCFIALGQHFALAQKVAISNPSWTEPDALSAIRQHDPTANPADQSESASTAGAPDPQPKQAKKKSGKRGALVIAPIPISSPAIGTGAIPVFAYIFPISKTDMISPPSVVGMGALVTNNDSRAFVFGGEVYFKENTYKATAGFGRGNLNYNLYGSGNETGLKLPLKQTGNAFRGEFQRRIGWEFFLGPRFSIGDSQITVRPSSGNTPHPPPDIGIDTTLTAVGLELTRDTSLNRFYPTSGTYFTFTSDFYSEKLGSKYSFQSYTTSFSKYWSWGESRVLAYNGFSCATGGKPPFFENCIYGSRNQLRGYVAGKYFDRYMVATQLEFRLGLPMRLGVVGFGGVGEAIPGGDQILFKDNSFLPSGGGGLRFELSKQYHVNLRADVARGRDGHTFSLGIGESF